MIYPKRISQNNYRDLDNKDVISLLACLFNRKIGYSMKESVEYVEGIPVSKVTDILNNKICELESEVKETKNLIDYLTTLKVESETDFYNIGNYWITVEPKCYLLPYAKISQSEFDNNIIGELNKGIMDKIWKSTKQYFTPYCEPIHAEDGRITHKPAVNRTFYVYSNLPEELFTTEVMLDQIRQQLIKDNGGVEDDLSNQYPNLFSDQEVYIYPIHDNTAIDTREGDSIKVVHPFDYVRIQETMKRFGLPIVTTADNYRQIEMFYVGIDTLDLNILNKYIYPLLAADYSVNKLSKPITSRFINYSPRTFTNYDGTGSEDDKFQFILLQILGYFEKSIEEDDLKNSLKRLDPNLELEIFTNEEYSEPRVTFKMRNTKFIVVWYTSMNS